jgi:hypothetical protein
MVEMKMTVTSTRSGLDRAMKMKLALLLQLNCRIQTTMWKWIALRNQLVKRILSQMELVMMEKVTTVMVTR